MSETKSERRMDAYYYSFEPTGADAVDIVLSAVACAGKAYHNTSDWGDDCDIAYNPEHRGANPVEWIQNAAEDAAASFKADLAQAREEGRREGAEQERARCVGIASREAGCRKAGDAQDALFGLVAMLHSEVTDAIMAKCRGEHLKGGT